MAAAVTLAPLTLESPWLVRPYDPELEHDGQREEDGLMYFLGIGYTRTRAGERAAAAHAGGSHSVEDRASGTKKDQATIDAERAFIDAHRFIWAWTLANADVSVAVDREKPWRIWAWLAATGNVIHAVGCKRSLITEKLSVEVVTELLGDRLRKHQVCSLELPQMRTRGREAIGIDRPHSWSMDPTWLLTRIPR